MNHTEVEEVLFDLNLKVQEARELNKAYCPLWLLLRIEKLLRACATQFKVDLGHLADEQTRIRKLNNQIVGLTLNLKEATLKRKKTNKNLILQYANLKETSKVKIAELVEENRELRAKLAKAEGDKESIDKLENIFYKKTTLGE